MINKLGIKALNADKFIKVTGSKGQLTNVAILDTGCNLEYKEITNVLDTKSFIQDNLGIKDMDGHGTGMAGIVKSLAEYGHILPIRVFNQYRMSFTSLITAALNYVNDWRGPRGEKIDIVNMSLSVDAEDEYMHAAIQRLRSNGVYIVAAAGNDGDGNPNTFEISFPGNWQEVICVANADYRGNIVPSSNSSRQMDISAPGKDILTCTRNGMYQSLTGTSPATAQVTGALALLHTAFKMRGIDVDKIDLKNELMRRCRTVVHNTYAEGAGFLDMSMLLDIFK